MKTIGFIDYYISEWHANNYVGWFKEVNEKLGDDFVVKYAWAEMDKSPLDDVTTDQWCEKYGVTKCDTIEELCEKADYILILSPSDPEKHLGYAEKALKYKKNTYIDKTFAPDYKTAKAIFDIYEYLANGYNLYLYLGIAGFVVLIELLISFVDYFLSYILRYFFISCNF